MMTALLHLILWTGLVTGKTPDAARSVTAAEKPDDRVAEKKTIAPGQPPLVSFRYYEGKLHHRFSNSGLMLDDAGH